MTLVLDLPPQAEAHPAQAANEAGLPIEQYALRLLMENIELPGNRIRQLAKEVGGHGYVADLSREAIYAE